MKIFISIFDQSNWFASPFSCLVKTLQNRKAYLPDLALAAQSAVMTSSMSTAKIWRTTQQLAYDEAYWFVFLPFDDHSLDAEDWCLFIACCCKVAERMCIAVKEKDRIRLLHTGRDVMSTLGRISVETYLDDIDDDFRNSFRDSHDFQATVDQASRLTRRRGILGWNWHGPQHNELKDFSKTEALRLQLLGEWSCLTEDQDQCVFDTVRQEEMSQFVLFDAGKGIDSMSARLWHRIISSPSQSMVSLPASWRFNRAKHLRLISQNGQCKTCKQPVDEEDTTRHILQCGKRCRSCGCFDHRICQTVVAAHAHIGRRSLLEIDDSIFAFCKVTSFVTPNVQFGVILDKRLCTFCDGQSSGRRMSGATVSRHSFDGGYGISFVSDNESCKCCGVLSGALTRLSSCAGCERVKYCSKDCQTKDWRRHKPECRSC